jgi:hypothetical protein
MSHASTPNAHAHSSRVTPPSPAALRRTPEGYFTVRWGQPEYTDWIDESMSWKETCYIGDWSFLWERRYRGRDAQCWGRSSSRLGQRAKRWPT